MFFNNFNRKNKVHIKDIICIYEDEFFKCDITYPIIYPLYKEQYQSIYLLNKLIRDDVISFKTMIKIQMIEYKNQYKKNQNQNNIKYQYQAYGEYEVNFNTNDILSISELFYEFSGGAHGMSYLHSYNYDINECRILTLRDIFKENVDYESLLNQFIKNEIQKDPTIYFSEDGFSKINKNQEFYLTPDGLVVYFQLYEIAPYSSGIRKFKLPYNQYKEYIKEKYITEGEM